MHACTCVARVVGVMLGKLVFEQKPCEEPNMLTSPFPEPLRDRCYAGFEVGPMSLTWPVGSSWQLPLSPQSVFRIALSVSRSRAQLPRASWGGPASSEAPVLGWGLAVAMAAIREGPSVLSMLAIPPEHAGAAWCPSWSHLLTSLWSTFSSPSLYQPHLSYHHPLP